LIHPALDASLVGCGYGSWDVLFCIASDAAQQAGICTRAGSNKFYRDGQYDFYDDNVYDDPAGLLSGEHDNPNNCNTHYADYPQLHGVGDNDSIPNLQGVWSTTASSVSTLPSTGNDDATWSGISNALHEDESWASIQPSSSENGYANRQVGSQYIALTGYSLNVPTDATIVSVVAAFKGYQYYTLDATDYYGNRSFRYKYAGLGGVFNAGIVLGGVLYPFADPTTIADFGPNPVPVHPSQPPWPSDVGGSYVSGVRVDRGIYTQPVGVRFLHWSGVTSPAWYGSELVQPDVPSYSDVLAAPLIHAYGLPVVEGPLFQGNIVGCPNTYGHNGPVEKTMNMIPTKQVWTPAEVNDPSFGAALSVWSSGVNSFVFPPGDQTNLIFQSYMFLNCIGIGVYYIPGGGGGGEGGGDNPLSKRPKVWIST
jgi:hypothetical protein